MTHLFHLTQPIEDHIGYVAIVRLPEAFMDDVRDQYRAILPASIRHRACFEDIPVHLHKFGADETVLEANYKPQSLYFVAKGWLSGSTTLLTTIRPIGMLRMRGDIVGLSWMDRPNYLEDVTTLTASELISVPVNDFKACLESDPVLHDFVRKELSRDLINLRMMSAVIGHMKAPDRLAYFLLILLNRFRRTHQTEDRTIALPLTQEEIGKILGLTNVSVNRAFRTLEAEGLIQSRRRSVTFLDEAAAARRFDLDKRQHLLEQLVGA